MSTGLPARREMKFIMGPKPRVCMFLSTAFNNDLKQPDVPRMQTLTEEQEHLHIILTSTSLKPRRQVAWSLIYKWGKPAVQTACAQVGPGSQRSPHLTAAYIHGCDHHDKQSHTPLSWFPQTNIWDIWIQRHSWFCFLFKRHNSHWVSTVLHQMPCMCCVTLWRIPFLLFCRWRKQRLRDQELGHVAVNRWEVGIQSQEGGPSLGTHGREFESQLYHLITATLDKIPSMFRPQFPYI